jgi:hypothetical protein
MGAERQPQILVLDLHQSGRPDIGRGRRFLLFRGGCAFRFGHSLIGFHNSRGRFDFRIRRNALFIDSSRSRMLFVRCPLRHRFGFRRKNFGNKHAVDVGPGDEQQRQSHNQCYIFFSHISTISQLDQH